MNYFPLAVAGMVLCMVGSTVAPNPTGILAIDMLFQFGALGLCAYMVFQNYRERATSLTQFEVQRKELLQVIGRLNVTIEQKNEKIEELFTRALEILKKPTH